MKNAALVLMLIISFVFIIAVIGFSQQAQIHEAVYMQTALSDSTTAPIPPPITDQLPNAVTVILGLVSAAIVEFIQKQKSALASVGIAVGVSVVGGIVSAVIVGASLSDFPVFIVQVFAMASTFWAALFKGAGLSKLLKTNTNS